MKVKHITMPDIYIIYINYNALFIKKLYLTLDIMFEFNDSLGR